MLLLGGNRCFSDSGGEVGGDISGTIGEDFDDIMKFILCRSRSNCSVVSLGM